MPAKIAEQFAALSLPEAVAVVLAIAYLLLAIRQNIWCWFCAAVSSAIYVYLFISAKLYMESALNGYYFLMAAYGWYVWHSGTERSSDLPVCTWPLRVHALAIASIAALAATSGFLLQRYTDAALPYIDSLTTFGAVWTTFLVARKVLENWWYWLVIDAASVAIYWSRDLPLTALLFVLYLCLIPFGLWSWRRSFLGQKPMLAQT
ncbi:MAG TPA: nicotinamide riboside transporter PnuC [Woeseiaceae bacterium]|nr:nicotinamide riboside transporter PnuC [Woeseiaceae bacterium]